ncbi:MAG: MFS transporter [Bacteroidota bacterium]
MHRTAVNVIFLINGFIYANWVSRLPRFQEQYEMDNGALGLILLLASIGALLSMPFAGWIIVKNGSRRVTLISSLLFCLIVPVFPLMPTAGSLGLAFFLMGIVTGIMDVAMNAQAVLVEQQWKKPILSSFHAIFSAGMMLGAGSGALFTHFELGLLWHLPAIGFASLFLALTVVRHLIPDPRSQDTSESEGPLFRLPSRALLGIGLIAFCCMLGEGAMSDWSTNFMENIAMADKSIAPLALAGFSTAMMCGRFLGDRARTAWGDARLLLFGGLLATLGIAVVLLFVHPWVSIGGFFIIGLGLATIVPIAYSIAGNSPGLAPGVGISMVTTIGYSGFLFGPPLIGFIADWQNLHLALFLVLALFLLMCLLSFVQYQKAMA